MYDLLIYFFSQTSYKHLSAQLHCKKNQQKEKERVKMHQFWNWNWRWALLIFSGEYIIEM